MHNPAGITLRTYTTQRVEVVGELAVHVVYGDKESDLSLVIVQGDGPALLGRDWLAHIRLDWSYLAYQLQRTFKLEEFLQKYEAHTDGEKEQCAQVFSTSYCPFCHQGCNWKRNREIGSNRSLGEGGVQPVGYSHCTSPQERWVIPVVQQL